ncbi:MAG: recombinase family protein [Bdellovibrionales bacterium]|nr:recombinase family protein [Bdellovibrionales bacterium]
MNSLVQSKNPFSKQVIRIAIYARYSSSGQNPQSAADQVKQIRRSIKDGTLNLAKYPRDKYEYVVPDEWVFMDEAMTGRTVVGRDGYDQFNKTLKKSDCAAGVVLELARLNRALNGTLDVYDNSKYHKKELVSLLDGISSEHPNSRVHFIVKGMINEMGNEIHAKRTRVGQVSRVVEGLSAGDICYGYRSRPTKTRSRGGYEIPSHFEIDVHPEEVRSVVLMFDLRIKGLGFAAIAKEFNRRGIPSSQRAQKISGKKINWSQNTVRKMLQNKKYIGQWTWGCSTRILNPETKKLERHDQTREKWVSHHEGEKIRDDLIIIDQERWSKVQAMFKTRTKKEIAPPDKWASAREEKANGIKSNALLAGLLKCGECGSNMLQITGRKGGFFGCFVHHRKDKSKCSNKRTISRRKIEAAVAAELKVVLLDDHNLSLATKLINKKIKDRLSVAPEEIRALMRDKHQIEKEIRNFTKFVMEGDSSASIRDGLREAEERGQIIDSQLKALQAARFENLLITPAAMRERLEGLTGILESDPMLANAALRKLIPAGLVCRPEANSAKKNLNQNNSKWSVAGEIYFAGASEQTVNITGYSSDSSHSINMTI